MSVAKWSVVPVVLALVVLGPWAGSSPADDKEKAGEKVYQTGRVVPPDLAERKQRCAERNAGFSFPRATAKSLDWVALGVVPPVVDQGNCGSCWVCAGCGCCTMAGIKAGVGKADGSYRLSEQYVLDCVRSGGCGGDDHSTVFDAALNKGLPTAADYGPYQARTGHCKPMTRFQRIKGWGYCEPGARGPASTQSIKDAMAAKGPISVAIAADSAFMNVRPGTVFEGTGSRNINHEVILVGWDDDKGAWKLRNSWGTGWADEGYCWIAYGANEVGTDAAWAEVESVIPPPPPPPPPAPPGAMPLWATILINALIAILSGLAGHAVGRRSLR